MWKSSLSRVKEEIAHEIAQFLITTLRVRACAYVRIIIIIKWVELASNRQYVGAGGANMVSVYSHAVSRTCDNEVGVVISIRDPYTSPFTSP